MTNVSFSDVTRFTAASAGSGSFVVSAAVTGYQTPLTAGASNFNYHYRAESADLTQWEVGLGAYTSSNTTLTRTPIFNSGGGSSVITFSAAPQVAFVFLAEDFNATGQIPGTGNNDNATTGNIGEYLTAANSSAITLSNNAAVNIASISLTSGDFDVWGAITFGNSGTTLYTACQCAIAVSSNSVPLPMNYQVTFTAGDAPTFPAQITRVVSSVTQTAFLNALAAWSSATPTPTAAGNIYARRRR